MKTQPIDWTSVCEFAPFSMVITDVQYKIKHLNNAFLRLLGFDRNIQLINRQIQDFCDVISINNSSGYQDSSRLFDQYELNFFSKIGFKTSAVAYVFPVEIDQNDESLAWFMVDISFLKKTNDLLQSRLVESESANSSKTFFMANISHNIRSHLNSILGLQQLVKNRAGKLDLPKEIEQYIKGIEFSSEQLQLLVNSILDLTAFEKGQLSVIQPTAFHVEQLIQSIFELFKEKAAEKSLWFTFEIAEKTPKHIRADRRILAQILTNLVDNAIKFTNKGNAVKLSAYIENHKMFFTVIDEGVGIEKDLQKSIFNLYDKVTGKNGTEKDIGLGLTIVKKLAELIEGNISVHSKSGEGSTFVLQIPLHEADSRAHQPQDTLSNNSSSMLSKDNRILVIEDDKMNVEVYKAWFEDFPFEVVYTENGNSGFELAKTLNFNLIITDIHLPGEDGIETINHLRKISHHQTTPIVVVSASTFTDKREQAFKAGCNEYFVKPIEFKKLLIVLEQYLKSVPKDKKIEIVFPEFKQITPDIEKVLLNHYKSLVITPLFYLEKITDKISNIKRVFLKLGYDGPSFLDLVETAAFEGNEDSLQNLTNQAIKHYYHIDQIESPTL